MPPRLALLIFTGFIVFLFVSDFRSGRRASIGLVIPLIWVLIIGSRPVSYWLNMGGPVQPVDYLEGSPLDRNVYMALIVAGLGVLLYRGFSWQNAIAENAVVTMFILYCGISVLWSDYPGVAFKRWVKEFGAVVMVLVVWSDAKPLQ